MTDAANAVAVSPTPSGGWPEALIRQIVDGRWVLFIGAGVAATCTNASGQSPPSWHDLLYRLADGVSDGDQRNRALALLDSNEYLSAAEQIRWSYQATSRLADYNEIIKTAVQGAADDPFSPGDAYTALLDLQPTIVITTNYDRLFETASTNGYHTFTYTDQAIGANVRRGEPLLLKLHGRIDDIERIVLTRSDYLRLKREGSHALETLRSLFQTHTALFVGYSVRDPDVQLVLEAGAGYCDPESHYLLTQQELEPWEQSTFQQFFGVAPLTYPTTASLVDVLGDLRNVVQARWQSQGIAP